MKEHIKNLGKVAMTPKGAWSIEKEYEILDIVHDFTTNHAYISKQEVPSGVDLSDSRYWMPLNVSGYSDSNVINLNTFNEDGEIQSYTLEKAIKTIKDVGRKLGAILIFYNNNADRLDITTGCWEIWQFNSVNIDDWENLDAWINIYYNYNKFVGWYATDNILNKEIPNPDVGCYAFVGDVYDEAFVYRCDVKNQWIKTNQKPQHYIKIVFGDNISIGENGNWWQNGIDTHIPVKGEPGKTPIIRNNNNILEYSYDNESWTPISEEIAAYFRWQSDGGQQANSIGKIQISRDKSIWTDLSGEFVNNLRISKYIGANDSLPTSGIVEGTIYAKGPTYASEDVSHTNPIYRLYVFTNNGWIDNGTFTSIAAGVVQEPGSSPTEVMSQKAVTERFITLNSKIGSVEKTTTTFNIPPGTPPSEYGSINLTLEAGQTYRIKINAETWNYYPVSYGILVIQKVPNGATDGTDIFDRLKNINNLPAYYEITAEEGYTYRISARTQAGSSCSGVIEKLPGGLSYDVSVLQEQMSNVPNIPRIIEYSGKGTAFVDVPLDLQSNKRYRLVINDFQATPSLQVNYAILVIQKARIGSTEGIDVFPRVYDYNKILDHYDIYAEEGYYYKVAIRAVSGTISTLSVSYIIEDINYNDSIYYIGEHISFSRNLFAVSPIKSLALSGKTFQGIATYKNRLVRLCDKGEALIYDISNGVDAAKLLNSFRLGSAGDLNHCNACQFASVNQDDYPLLYVSANYVSKCYVEQLTDNGSTLLQTIILNISEIENSGMHPNIVIGDDGFLWSIMGVPSTASVWFHKLRLPQISEGNVTLTESDVIESFKVSSYDMGLATWQGVKVYGRRAYFVWGTPSSTRGVEVYNLTTKRRDSFIPLNNIMTNEPEDCEIIGNKLLVSDVSTDGSIVITIL